MQIQASSSDSDDDSSVEMQEAMNMEEEDTALLLMDTREDLSKMDIASATIALIEDSATMEEAVPSAPELHEQTRNDVSNLCSECGYEHEDIKQTKKRKDGKTCPRNKSLWKFMFNKGELDKYKTKDITNALRPLDKQKNSFEPKQTIETKTNCF